MLRILLLIVIATALPVSAQDAGYAKTIEPFLKSYCVECHTGEKAKGEFRVDAKSLPDQFNDLAIKGKWREVVNVLNSHEMPPKKANQPKVAEVAAVVDWITEQTTKAELAQRSNTVVLRRLNRAEYKNTIRDLIGNGL